MRKKAENGEPFLTGALSNAYICYAYSTSSGARVQGEPVVKFSGEVVPFYNGRMKDDEVIEVLNDLAAHLGAATEQTRVYVRYRDSTWILQKEGKKTPTGE
ncbi:MAG: hypothetical protein GF334_05325 [Candidatus Altiarchaeales archaeon]|nr:hypothetical protein [Candidatus Altiarchaeales archaeon]